MKAVIEERLPATLDNEDDMYEDDGEADIDVDSLLLAAASTPNVKAKEVKTEPRTEPSVSGQQVLMKSMCDPKVSLAVDVSMQTSIFLNTR